MIKVNTVPIRFQIDSGADVNIIDEDSFSKLKERMTLGKSRAKLFLYNSVTPLPILGKFTAAIATKKRYDVTDFYVAKGSKSSKCLLGSTSAVNLGILHIVSRVKEISTSSRASSV